MRIVAGLFGGLILAVICAMLVTVTFAASPEKAGSWGAGSFLIFWVIGIVIAVLAKSAAKAWRRLLLTSAVLSFLRVCGLLPRHSFFGYRPFGWPR